MQLQQEPIRFQVRTRFRTREQFKPGQYPQESLRFLLICQAQKVELRYRTLLKT